MNYLRNIFTKKPNRDAEVIADKLYHGNVDLTYKNIDSIIEEYNIKVKKDASFYKDVEDQYNKLVITYNKIEAENEDKEALANVIKGNNIPVSAKLAKQLALPISSPKNLSMSMESGEDEWVDTSSSIEGGARRKRRKTKGKKTKRRKTRRNKRY